MIFADFNNFPIQSGPHVSLSPHCTLQQYSREVNILRHNNDWQSVTILLFTLHDIKKQQFERAPMTGGGREGAFGKPCSTAQPPAC